LIVLHIQVYDIHNRILPSPILSAAASSFASLSRSNSDVSTSPAVLRSYSRADSVTSFTLSPEQQSSPLVTPPASSASRSNTTASGAASTAPYNPFSRHNSRASAAPRPASASRPALKLHPVLLLLPLFLPIQNESPFQRRILELLPFSHAFFREIILELLRLQLRVTLLFIGDLQMCPPTLLYLPLTLHPTQQVS